MVTNVAELAASAAFPPVAVSLIRLLVEDDLDWNAINEGIRGDAAFAAHILQRANSPQFGFATRIDNVPRALQALGMPRARKLVLSACVSAHLSEVLMVPSLRRCWRHTIATALLTEELAWACSLSEERAFASGLLHDLGRLILVAAFPASNNVTEGRNRSRF